MFGGKELAVKVTAIRWAISLAIEIKTSYQVREMV